MVERQWQANDLGSTLSMCPLRLQVKKLNLGPTFNGDCNDYSGGTQKLMTCLNVMDSWIFPLRTIVMWLLWLLQHQLLQTVWIAKKEKYISKSTQQKQQVSVTRNGYRVSSSASVVTYTRSATSIARRPQAVTTFDPVVLQRMRATCGTYFKYK